MNLRYVAIWLYFIHSGDILVMEMDVDIETLAVVKAWINMLILSMGEFLTAMLVLYLNVDHHCGILAVGVEVQQVIGIGVFRWSLIN